MMKSVLVASFLVSMLSFSGVASAQFVSGGDIGSTIALYLGVPPEWLYPPELIFNFIVPFLAIFAVVLFFMRAIRIMPYNSKLEAFISFLIAFSTLPTHVFFWLVSVMLQALGYLAFFAFVGLFAIGVAMYTTRKSIGWHQKIQRMNTHHRRIMMLEANLRREIDRMDQREDDIKERMFEENISDSEFNRLERELATIRKRKAELTDHLESARREAR